MQKFLNNFTTTFIASVKDTAVTGTPATELDYGILRISDGAAGTLSNPTGGDFYVLTAFKKSGTVETNIEIMKVTAVDNSTVNECRITVLRAQEGTTAKAYVSGDYVALRLTAGGTGVFAQTADLTKASVGLSNVGNTSDADKPVSTAQQTALNLKQDTSEKDQSNGYAGLTLFRLNLRNALNTVTSWFTTAATVARTWTLPDKDGTVAMTSDITGGTSAGSFTNLTTGGGLTQISYGTVTPQIFKAYGGTIASPSATQTGPVINVLGSTTSDGVNFLNTAQIYVAAESVPTAGSHPTFFALALTSAGSTSRTERLRVDSGGNVLVTSPALLGYGTGAGGTVTQATSKATAVTLNKPCGVITTNTAELAAGASVVFTFNNSLLTVGSVVIVNTGQSFGDRYRVEAFAVQASLCGIRVTNIIGSAVSDALTVNFAIIQGATA